VVSSTRQSRIATLSLVACSAVAVHPSPVRAEDHADEVVVDRVVAVVGAAGERGSALRIVTAFELEVEARLMLAERARSVDAASARLDAQLLDTVLGSIVNQLLLSEEAARLQLVTVSDEQIAAERGSLEERLGGPGSIERFCAITSASSGLIDDIVRRRLVAAEFVQQNIQLASSVSDADVEDAFLAGNHPFGDRPLEEIREQLEAFILARRQRQRLEQWLEDARERSVIRIIPL
jgi:hypothetical protein